MTVSHCQMLIRSVRDPNHSDDHNIDLVFNGVFYVELTDTFRGLTVQSATVEEEEYIRKRVSSALGETKRYYALHSSGKKYLIGAVSMDIDKNTLPLMQSSLWRPSEDDFNTVMEST
jgi:hypothetical protein